MRQYLAKVLLVVLFVSGAFGAGGLAAQQTVGSAAQLQQAIGSASAGQVILLEPGDYGTLQLRGLRGGITLRSANPADMAKFSALFVEDVQNLVLDSLAFNYRFGSDDPKEGQTFRIANSRNVTISKSVFTGDVARSSNQQDNGFPWSTGLGIRGSRDIVLSGSVIRRFHTGLDVKQSDAVTIRANNFTQMRRDSMNFAQVTDVLIENNLIHDFARSPTAGDHSDMIQFWTTATRSPSRNITIRNNIFNSGDGLYTQTIFMRNELVDQGQAGPEMFYRNIEISNNLILNGHLHGITIGEVDGLTIARNTLLQNPLSAGGPITDELWVPRINVTSRAKNVSIRNNLVSEIRGYDGQRDWRVDGNVVIQPRSSLAPGYYPTVFDFAPNANRADLRSYRIRPGGPADSAEVGSTILRDLIAN
jgi:hypothetical protein